MANSSGGDGETMESLLSTLLGNNSISSLVMIIKLYLMLLFLLLYLVCYLYVLVKYFFFSEAMFLLDKNCFFR